MLIGGWFVVMALTVNGALRPDITLAVAQGHTYGSRAGCLADGKELARLLRSAGARAGETVHGRLLCMQHDETDAELAREPRIYF